jgi:hypothetical protein
VTPTVEQIGSLLALKREERPEEGYWQDFLCEFHHRQREEAVKSRTLSGMWERTTDWFSELGGAKWLYGAGLAYLLLFSALVITPGGQEKTPGSVVPVSHQIVPTAAPAVEQLDELDLGPTTQGSAGEQVF